MKLLNDKKDDQILSLYANASGDIISGNENIINKVSYSGSLCNITDILSKNSALELSMSMKEHLMVETNISGYKNGVIMQTGKGFSLRQELFLFSDKYASSHITNKDLDTVLSAIKEKQMKNKISLRYIVESSIKELKEKFPDISVSLEEESTENTVIKGDYKKLKMLILSIFSVLFEVDIIGDIRVSARDRNRCREIVFTAQATEIKILNGIVDFCNAYPFSSTSSVYTRALCNQMGIELNVFQEYDHVELFVSLGLDEEDIYSVYAEDESKDRELYISCMRVFFKTNK